MRGARLRRRPGEGGDATIASFLVIADPDHARRDAFVARAATELAPVAGCVVGRIECSDVVICWATGGGAPVTTYEGPEACAVLWGDALRRGERARLTASALWRAWIDPSARPEVFDGFHAGVAVGGGEVVVGSDLLGLFPVYHASRGDVWLTGSSAAPFTLHPLFSAVLDVDALLGHLLTGGPFDGRTIVRGVTRLGPGALVRWRQGEVAREVPRYQLPAARDIGARPMVAEVEELGAALENAVCRHAALHDDLALLLSGGRDSRLIAGYLARARCPARAVSLGRPSDHDAACAARVAQALGMLHTIREIPFDDFPGFADDSVRLEQLAGGMSNVHTWGNGRAVGPAGGVLTGYLLEVRQIAPLPAGRDGVLGWSHARAFAPERLRPLLRDAGMVSRMDAVRDAIAHRYESIDAAERDRPWRWAMSTYARFHAGAVPWRLSFWSWPILPILDQQLLETMFSLPETSLSNRRLQDALLRVRFPGLARLPLDRNSHDVRPIAPAWGDRLTARARRLASSVRAVGTRRRATGDATGSTHAERRYYVRMYDFDNAGWLAIRRAAEGGRQALGEWFNLEALQSLVPAPGQRVAHHDPIGDGFAPKMLTGFMRWNALREGWRG